MSITRIVNHIAVIDANRNPDRTQLHIRESVERLSSGLRIHHVDDEAAISRLESTMANLSVSSENLAASEPWLRDMDIVGESGEFTENQANLASQGFLTLLR